MGIPAEERPNIDTFILAGSVLKPGFAWRELVGSCVRRVVNECGTRDRILLINQAFVLFTGMAGRVGFSGMTGRAFRNRYFEFGHSGYFEESEVATGAFMKTYWLPLLHGSNDIAVVSDPRSGGPLHGLRTFLLNNIEPIKLACYLAPAVAGTLWVYGLYLEADEQRDIAEQRSVVATSRMLMDSQPTDANLLALELRDPDLVPGALALLFEALSNSLDEPVMLKSEGVKVHDLAISEDGSRVLVESQIGAAGGSLIEVFEIDTGRPVLRLEGEDASVGAVAFLTPDKLAMIGWNHQVLVYEDGKRSVLSALPGTDSALSPNGKLAVQATATSITVWNMNSGQQLFSGDVPESLSNLRIGDDLASLTLETEVDSGRVKSNRVWRWSDVTGSWLAVEEDFDQHRVSSQVGGYALEGTSIVSIAGGEKVSDLDLGDFGSYYEHFEFSFSPDGQLLLGRRSEQWVLWRSSSGEIAKSLPPSDGGRFRFLTDAQFSPVGDLAVASETDGALQVLQTRPPYKTSILRAHTYPFTMAFTPNGTLVTGTGDGEVARWSLTTGRQPFALSPKHDSDFQEFGRLPLDIAIHPDGHRVAVMYANGTAKMWSVVDGREVVSLETGGTEGFDQGVEFLSSRLIVYGVDGLWSVDEDGALQQWETESPGLISLRKTNDGRLLVGGTADGNVELLDSENGSTRSWIAEGEGPGFETPRRGMDADYCSKRKLAAINVSYGFAGVVELWKLGAEEAVGGLPHEEQVWSAAFSADCERVLTAAQDGVVRVWGSDSRDVEISLDLSKEIEALGNVPLIKAYWGRAEQSIIVINAGGPIWIYDASLRRQLAAIADRRYFSVSPMHHQEGVVAGSAEGDIYLWPLDSDELRGLLRARTSRCLTDRQRIDYLSEARGKAQSGETSCTECVPKFFSDLAASGLDHGGELDHAEAWRRYFACVDR